MRKHLVVVGVFILAAGILVGVVGAQLAPRWMSEHHETVLDVEVPEPPAPPLPAGTALLRTLCDRDTGTRVYLLAHADPLKPGGLSYVGISTVAQGCPVAAAPAPTSAETAPGVRDR